MKIIEYITKDYNKTMSYYKSLPLNIQLLDLFNIIILLICTIFYEVTYFNYKAITIIHNRLFLAIILTLYYIILVYMFNVIHHIYCYTIATYLLLFEDRKK